MIRDWAKECECEYSYFIGFIIAGCCALITAATGKLWVSIFELGLGIFILMIGYYIYKNPVKNEAKKPVGKKDVKDSSHN
ncbi:MAG: hypothetical protein WC499_04955 [Patescibacteria group bacterium]